MLTAHLSHSGDIEELSEGLPGWPVSPIILSKVR